MSNQVIGRVLVVWSIMGDGKKMFHKRTTPKFEPLKVKMNVLVNMQKGAFVVRREGGKDLVSDAVSELELCVGDIIITGKTTLCVFEYLLGGITQVNSNAAVQIINERLVSDLPLGWRADTLFHGARLHSMDELVRNTPHELNPGIYLPRFGPASILGIKD